jgi:hypothetical protein
VDVDGEEPVTAPQLAVGVVKRGRMYPWLPQDPSGWPRNRWGSVNVEDIPVGVEMVPSVTNVLSVYSDGGDGLLYWAGEQAVRAMYRDGFPEDVDRAVELHRGAFRKARDARAEAGTRAHTLAEALASDLPLPATISDEDEQFADGFMQFWTDLQPEPVHTEVTVYGDGYAGTADLIALVGGVPTVIDYKTRGKAEKKPTVYDKTRMQLAGLACALDVATPNDAGWQVEVLDVRQAMAVILYPNGTYHAEVVDGLYRWQGAFNAAVDLWHWVKGTPAPSEGGAEGTGGASERSSADRNGRGQA